MDLTVTIKDDQDNVLSTVRIYQDGSDSEGAEEITAMLHSRFEIDYEELKQSVHEPCPNCAKETEMHLPCQTCDHCGLYMAACNACRHHEEQNPQPCGTCRYASNFVERDTDNIPEDSNDE